MLLLVGSNLFGGRLGAVIHERMFMNNLTDRVITHPFFNGMKESHLAILAECATEVEFQPGQILFRQGDPANKFYLIDSGKIAIEAHAPADGTAVVQQLGAGEVLGWSWLYPPFVWHFQARAVEPTRAIVLSGGHLLNAAESDHDFGYELMKRISQMVIHRLQATRKQLLAVQARSVAKI